MTNFEPIYERPPVTEADHARLLLQLLNNLQNINCRRWGLPVGFNPLICYAHTLLNKSDFLASHDRVHAIWLRVDALANDFKVVISQLHPYDKYKYRVNEGIQRFRKLPSPLQKRVESAIEALSVPTLKEELKSIIANE